MICFIEECHSDTLLYYPIIKKLEERKTDYIVYDVRGKSTIDTIHFLSQNPTIKSVVNYGGSLRKLTVASLCKEYELLFINLHGNERIGELDVESFLPTISSLAYQNFVSGDPARTFLLDRGIKTPIGCFECPITYLTRKSQNVEPFDILYISGDPVKIDLHEREMIRHKYKYKVFDLSNGLPQNWKDIYPHLRGAKYIVSDLFIFDRPSRNLNKHFFYFGGDVLDTQHLGISTHIMSKRFELHDYLKQSWSPLQDVNQKWGLEPLLQNL
jgi:hypothetical protein